MVWRFPACGGGSDPKRVAVEINGSIIKRTDFKEIVFSAGDSVEIVCFVGGG